MLFDNRAAAGVSLDTGAARSLFAVVTRVYAEPAGYADAICTMNVACWKMRKSLDATGSVRTTVVY